MRCVHAMETCFTTYLEVGEHDLDFGANARPVRAKRPVASEKGHHDNDGRHDCQRKHGLGLGVAGARPVQGGVKDSALTRQSEQKAERGVQHPTPARQTHRFMPPALTCSPQRT